MAYIASILTAILLSELAPYLEELVRGLKAIQAGSSLIVTMRVDGAPPKARRFLDNWRRGRPPLCMSVLTAASRLGAAAPLC